MSNSKKEFIYLFSILILLLIINYRVLDTWFMVDDTANIFCSSFNTLKLLFDKYTYLYSNQMFFTPLLPVSFKLDWLFFKMNPLGYHIINLLAAYLCCFLFYKFQRIYFKPFSSWVGTVFLAISLPMSFDIGWITRKHYLWGFLLALIAVYLFKRWEGNKKNCILLFSFIGTLLSFLFKEAFTFLPALVFVISSGSVKERARKAIPYFFVLAAYIFWRIYMLGGLGGYPGSTDRSFIFLLNKLLYLPIDLSKNLYGFSFLPFLFLATLAVLDYRLLILIALTSLIVVSPFIFYPPGDFLLANKALSFVAVFSFALSYITNELSLRRKKAYLVIFLLFIVPILFSSVSKIRLSQRAIVHLSSKYEKASKEIIKSSNEKILIVGNYSYYFSNLEDIYRNMLKKDFSYIKSLSDIVVLPYLEKNDFDKVILIKNLNLNPDIASASTVDILKGLESKQYILENLRSKDFIPPPEINFIPASDHLDIEITDSREGTYLRCLYMGSYVGCYPIPKRYVLRYNRIKKIEKVDIIFQSAKGEISRPATFKDFNYDSLKIIPF